MSCATPPRPQSGWAGALPGISRRRTRCPPRPRLRRAVRSGRRSGHRRTSGRWVRHLRGFPGSSAASRLRRPPHLAPRHRPQTRPRPAEARRRDAATRQHRRVPADEAVELRLSRDRAREVWRPADAVRRLEQGDVMADPDPRPGPRSGGSRCPGARRSGSRARPAGHAAAEGVVRGGLVAGGISPHPTRAWRRSRSRCRPPKWRDRRLDGRRRSTVSPVGVAPSVTDLETQRRERPRLRDSGPCERGCAVSRAQIERREEMRIVRHPATPRALRPTDRAPRRNARRATCAPGRGGLNARGSRPPLTGRRRRDAPPSRRDG